MIPKACKEAARRAPLLAWAFGVVCASGVAVAQTAPEAMAEPEAEDRLEARRQEARQAFRAGRIIDVVDLLDELLKLEPDNAEMHRLQGRALMQPSLVQDLAEADREFARAFELGDASAAVWRADLQLQRQDFAAARQRIEQLGDGREALARPTRMHLLVVEAALILADGTAAGARSRAEEAWRLGRECLQERRAAEQPLLGTVPELLLRAREVRLQALLAGGWNDEARAAADQLVVQYPDDASYRRLLAAALRGAEDAEGAARQERAAELLEAIAATSLRQPVEVLEPLFEELDAIEPRSPRNALRLARACLARRVYRKTVDLCQRFRQDAVTSGAPARLIAEAWYIEGRANLAIPAYLPRAAECFRAAARYSPDFAPECERLLEQIRRQMSGAPPR